MLPIAGILRAPWRTGITALFASAIISTTLTSCAPAAVTLTAPVLAITTTGTGSSVKVVPTEEGTVLEVRSESGIGTATIEATAGNTLPAQLTLHLHLTGLEELRLIYGQTELVAAVNTSGAPIASEAVRKADGTSLRLTAQDPQWADIHIVSEIAEPMVPLTQGYFAVTLPKEFATAVNGAPPATLQIRWIDFYR